MAYSFVGAPINVRSREGEPPVSVSQTDATTLQRAGVIGNGTLSAVINHLGRYVWLCPGHFSGDPIFNSLLNNESKECGFMDVLLTGLSHSQQEYARNTGVLRTRLFSDSGNSIEITDFCPRFSIYERMHSPFQVIRILRRLAGDPLITVRVRPTFMNNSTEGVNTRGSHHIRFCGPKNSWRVTTTASVAKVLREVPFVLQLPIYLVLGSDESLECDVPEMCLEFERRCVAYWRDWVNNLSLPSEYQEVLIRCAITVQMLASEDHGGLFSSFTVGIPIGANAAPTRDERIFRLMEECLALLPLRCMGMLPASRKFLDFVKNMTMLPGQQLCYGVDEEDTVPLMHQAYLAGFRGVGPIYTGGVTPLWTPEWTDGVVCRRPSATEKTLRKQPTQAPGLRGLTANGTGQQPLTPFHASPIARASFEVALGIYVIALCSTFFDERLNTLYTPRLFSTITSMARRCAQAFVVLLDAAQGAALEHNARDLFVALGRYQRQLQDLLETPSSTSDPPLSASSSDVPALRNQTRRRDQGIMLSGSSLRSSEEGITSNDPWTATDSEELMRMGGVAPLLGGLGLLDDEPVAIHALDGETAETLARVTLIRRELRLPKTEITNLSLHEKTVISGWCCSVQVQRPRAPCAGMGAAL